jgi:AcrR family transcriptional regulator
MARPRRFDVGSLRVAGVAVARRDGWAAVTLRAVAEELGVSPMALYRVARDAEQLRRLVADAAAPPVPAAGSRAERLEAWAVAAHADLGRAPGLAGYVVAHWTELPAWLDVVEALLADAVADGRDGPDAVAAVNAVFAYVLARAQLRDGLVAAPERRLAPLQDGPDRYPHLLENRPEFARARVGEHFRFGLTALLAGLDIVMVDRDS